MPYDHIQYIQTMYSGGLIHGEHSTAVRSSWHDGAITSTSRAANPMPDSVIEIEPSWTVRLSDKYEYTLHGDECYMVFTSQEEAKPRTKGELLEFLGE